MRATLERELKLQPGPGFTMPELPGEPLVPRVFTSTYHDTPSRSLARCGITLRCRVEDGVSRWQLKLPRDRARAELEATGAPDQVPAEIEALLTAHLRHGSLEPIAALLTHRAGVRVVAGERSLADVLVDKVDVLGDGHRVSGFSEIEVELVDGDEDDLERLGAVLRSAGARRTKGAAKVMRVLDLEAAAPPASDAPALDHLRFLLARQLSELKAHDPGVRLGTDIEDLHRFRVATRRSRALIRASRPLVGTQLAALAEELRWLGGVLGPSRDLDVLIEHLRAVVATLDDDVAAGEAIVAQFEEERLAARALVLEALGSERYLALLDRFGVDLDALTDPGTSIGLAGIAQTEARRLVRTHAKLGLNPDDDTLHALRIKAKHLRYAAELAAGTGDRRFAALTRVARDLQDLIGSHQDAVVAEERVRALAGLASALAAGRIIAEERRRRAAARADLPACWTRVERAIARSR